MGDHRQVVANHDEAQAAPAAQLFQQIQHLGLHRRIERRRGFIQQQDLRLQDQRPCNRNALALAARQLVRIDHRIKHKPRITANFDEKLQSLEQKRRDLKAYAELLNSVHGNHQTLTVHQILWKAENFRRRAPEACETVRELWFAPAPAISTPEFEALRDLDGMVLAICKALTRKPGKLTGAEFRYLRQHLGLS